MESFVASWQAAPAEGGGERFKSKKNKTKSKSINMYDCIIQRLLTMKANMNDGVHLRRIKWEDPSRYGGFDTFYYDYYM